MNDEPPSIDREASGIAINFPIKDVIVIDPAYGPGASGIVLALEVFRPPDPQSLVGTSAAIRIPGGWTLTGEISEIRDHGATCSIFFRDWPDGFPWPEVGWLVEFPAAREL